MNGRIVQAVWIATQARRNQLSRCLLIVSRLWLDALGRTFLLSDWTTVFTSSCSLIGHQRSALPALWLAAGVQLFLLSDRLSMLWPPALWLDTRVQVMRPAALWSAAGVQLFLLSDWPTVFKLRVVLSSAVVVVVQAENKKTTRASDWVCVSSPPSPRLLPPLRPPATLAHQQQLHDWVTLLNWWRHWNTSCPAPQPRLHN